MPSNKKYIDSRRMKTWEDRLDVILGVSCIVSLFFMDFASSRGLPGWLAPFILAVLLILTHFIFRLIENHVEKSKQTKASKWRSLLFQIFAGPFFTGYGLYSIFTQKVYYKSDILMTYGAGAIIYGLTFLILGLLCIWVLVLKTVNIFHRIESLNRTEKDIEYYGFFVELIYAFFFIKGLAEFH